MKKFFLCFLLALSASAADGVTNTITFTNRFGLVFKDVLIEKANGEFVSWVSATNALVFGRCPVGTLTRETYQRIGLVDSEVFDAARAREKAQRESAVKRKAPLLSGRVALAMTAEELEGVLGKPAQINRSVYEDGVHEQWVYGSSYVYLREGKVTSWQESE